MKRSDQIAIVLFLAAGAILISHNAQLNEEQILKENNGWTNLPSESVRMTYDLSLISQAEQAQIKSETEILEGGSAIYFKNQGHAIYPCDYHLLRGVYYPENPEKGLVFDCGPSAKLETLKPEDLKRIEMHLGNYDGVGLIPNADRDDADGPIIKWKDNDFTLIRPGEMQIFRSKESIN
jgi:hypothetical protein